MLEIQLSSFHMINQGTVTVADRELTKPINELSNSLKSSFFTSLLEQYSYSLQPPLLTQNSVFMFGNSYITW